MSDVFNKYTRRVTGQKPLTENRKSTRLIAAHSVRTPSYGGGSERKRKNPRETCLAQRHASNGGGEGSTRDVTARSPVHAVVNTGWRVINIRRHVCSTRPYHWYRAHRYPPLLLRTVARTSARTRERTHTRARALLHAHVILLP